MSTNRYAPWLAGSALVLAGVASLGVHAASNQTTTYYPNYSPDTARITTAIDNSNLVSVQNSKPAMAIAKYDIGALPSTQPIRDVTLLLKRSDTKQKQFDSYLAQLNNPSSPYFHHWLTAAQIGTMFGPAMSDITAVTQWLRSQGLKVKSVSPTGMMIHFSGTASAVGNTFHTTLHNYAVNGEKHFANATAQQIPAALVPVVQGTASLGNFFPKPLHHDVATVARNKKTGSWQIVAKAKSAPQFTVPIQPPGATVQTAYDVAPADFDKIYNVNPLWIESTPIRGATQTIAVLERTDVLPADIQTFRSTFLPSDAQGIVSITHPTPYPGFPSCSDPGRIYPDEGEAAIDAEWAGAAAPDANIMVASCDDSDSATFGPFQAAENLLDNPPPTGLPQVFSLSYGECELSGLANGMTYSSWELWSTAAMEGVTVFVSSGDSGSVNCDNPDEEPYAVEGLSVNALASTPDNVAVGGTDFNDFTNYGQYWTSSNLPLNESAVSYIPEMTWNDSCAGSVLYGLLGYKNGVEACNGVYGLQQYQYLNISGGGGGPSTTWVQQEWQSGIYGSTNYNLRMLPDVSLFSANGAFGHALVYCMSDPNTYGTPCDYSNPSDIVFNSAGGTSFAAPAMAGVQALINQATGGIGNTQMFGNMLPVLYNLAMKEYGTNGSPNTSMLQVCNSSNGANIDSNCVFNNITVGNNDEPCYAGGQDCYGGSGVVTLGVASADGFGSLAPAWQTNAGYSMATGLGSINAANLVNAVAKFYKPFSNGYVSPYDFMGPDGFSDIALIDPVKGTFTSLGMKGSVVEQNGIEQNIGQSITPGYTIGAVNNFALSYADSLLWTGPDNRLYLWESDGAGGVYDYTHIAIGDPYPAGWALMGSAVTDGSLMPKLFWFNATTAQFGWWGLGEDPNTYQPVASIGAITNVTPGYTPTLADVNGDGYADIIWTSPSTNLVYIWINNQLGSYVAHASAVNRPAGFTLFGAGDIDGDGKTELIWTNPTTHQMAWWVMDGFNVKDQEVRSVAPGYTMASIEDFDGDGLADILWVGAAGDAYEWQSDGTGFQSFRVADASGKPLAIPAGTQVQPNRLQGGLVTGRANLGLNISW